MPVAFIFLMDKNNVILSSYALLYQIRHKSKKCPGKYKKHHLMVNDYSDNAKKKNKKRPPIHLPMTV